jgi:hypothetical protein
MQKLERLEEKVPFHKNATNNKKIDKELAHIILDIGFSQTRTTKYFMSLNLYYHTKEIIVCHMDSTLEKNKPLLSNILKKLHQINDKYFFLLKIIKIQITI